MTTAGTGEYPGDAEVKAAEKSDRDSYCAADPDKAVEVTLWVFLGCAVTVLLISYWIGPVKVMEMVFDHLVPKDTGLGYALVLVCLIAILMVVPVPIALIVLVIPGIVYGFWMGYLIVFVSLLIGVTIAYIIGQSLLQEQFRRFLKQGKYERTQRALKILETDEESFFLLVVYRFLCMPFFMRNYGPTILDIPLWKLVLSSIPHHLWVAFVFTSFGVLFKDTADVLRKDGATGFTNLTWRQIAPSAAALVGSVLASFLGYRIYQRAEGGSEEHQPLAQPLASPQSA